MHSGVLASRFRKFGSIPSPPFPPRRDETSSLWFSAVLKSRTPSPVFLRLHLWQPPVSGHPAPDWQYRETEHSALLGTLHIARPAQFQINFCYFESVVGAYHSLNALFALRDSS
jgi:hypothetical protein